MKMTIITSLLLLFYSCSSVSQNDISLQLYGNHFEQKNTISISTPQGKELLNKINLKKYDQLKKYWTAQLPNHCGVCSSVIVINTLKNNANLDQINYFTSPVKNVIEPSTVSKMGLTLRELCETLSITDKSLNIQKNYAHISGLDLFVAQLNNYAQSPEFIIVNFSRKSLTGEGMTSGHFSIVAGYEKTSRMVLILEVNGEKESFWISDKDLYTAMNAIDPVSKIPRGWAVLKP